MILTIYTYALMFLLVLGTGMGMARNSYFGLVETILLAPIFAKALGLI